MDNLYIIIVFFNPTIVQIKIASELAKSNNVFVIDNSSNIINQEYCFEYVPLFENKGIAYAQNVGIEQALRAGAEYILFFDQDSNASDNYPQLILNEFKRLKKMDSSTAMLGPTIIDERSGNSISCAGKSQEFIKVDCLINSGMITDKETIAKIGLFDSKLFIDYVDFEWSWRALSHNLSCYRSSKIFLIHSIGRRYYYYHGFTLYISAPIRYYYQYRNFLILLKRNYVPFSWKFKGLLRKSIDVVILPFFAKESLLILKNILKGTKDGLFAK